MKGGKVEVQMAKCGLTENVDVSRRLLILLVGAWGFEPQTPTVSMKCSTRGEVF